MRNTETQRHLVLADDLPASVAQVVIDAALDVLRPTVTEVWIDALSDRPWPEAVAPIVSELRTLGGSQTTGIDLDLGDDHHLRLLRTLALFTIHAEAWAGRTLVFSANDTGTSVVMCLTPDQEMALRALLSTGGVSPDEVIRAP